MMLATPQEIAAHVLLRWEPESGDKTRLKSVSPLPPPHQKVLERVVAVAFEASLLQDEGRPTTLRLLLHPPEALPSDVGPPTDLQRLVFQQPRPFTAQELRRLSPAASFHRSLIGITSEPLPSLAIWGLLQSGPRWLQNIQGGRGPAPQSPDCVIVAVTGPGCLDIYRGSQLLVTVRAGHIARWTLDVFQADWIRGRFADIRADLYEMHGRARAAQNERWATLDGNISRHISQHMFRRLITTVRNARHGGTLIVLPEDAVRNLKNSESQLKLKYQFVDDPARGRFNRLIVSIMNAIAAAGGRMGRPAEAPIGWDDYNQMHHEELVDLDEGIFEMSHLIAQLMGVDGAVALTRRMELLGFGAEIVGNLPEVATVRRALDAEGARFVHEGTEEVGIRHRSAYRLCGALRDALLVVISQDGGVSFICWKDDAVTYWPHETNTPTGL